MKKKTPLIKKLVKFALDKHAYKDYQRIFLLSHMRANTSLLGHIFGSSDEINGYYEKHISYGNKRFAFLNQKIEHANHHRFKPHSRYLFDKLLHDEYTVHKDILRRDDSQFIISLRSPQNTIPSIMSQVGKRVDNNQRATFEGARDYYTQRLNTLLGYAELLSGKFIYLDADALRDNTDMSLTFLQNNLGLSQPLTPEFKKQTLTGSGSGGDHSGNLNKGTITKQKSNYSDIDIPQQGMEALMAFYHDVRLKMTALAKASLTE